MTHFKLHTNCKITKGHNRSIISDFQRLKTLLIPNEAVEIIEKLNSERISINEVVIQYGQENEEIILEYLNFFVENELGFFCQKTDFKLYPEMSTEYLIPNMIHNAVIENEEFDIKKLTVILNQLHQLGCNFLHIYFKPIINVREIQELNELIQSLRFISFELTINFDILHFNQIIDFYKQNENKLAALTFYNSPYNQTFKFGVLSLFEIYYVEKDISNFNSCGIVEPKNFVSHQDNYLESLNHNSCLHKKIAIDKEGNIKNCPAMGQCFGNIKNTTLKQAVGKANFKKYWNITKDQVDTCKDCEFRHICTDCRAFVEDPNSDFSKPLKCGYNPYTNEWEEWGENPLKQKAIEFYGFNSND